MRPIYTFLCYRLTVSFLGTVGSDDIDIINSKVTVYECVGLQNFDDMICVIPKTVFKPSFSFLELLDSLSFDHKFKSGRWTQFFGKTPYKYGTTFHHPCPIYSNSYVSEMLQFVTDTFPELTPNSCLINYYPHQQSSIPYHCDDESCIADNSFILTLSFGSNRRMFFKDICTGESLCSIALQNCSVLIFSKASQFRFAHCVPSEEKGSDYSPRISATFRYIR